MFFSATGNSREGIYWLNYVTSWGNDLIEEAYHNAFVTVNQAGAVCVDESNLSTVFVPTPSYYAPMAINVGSTVDFDLVPEN